MKDANTREEDVSQRDSVNEDCIDFVVELVELMLEE